MGSIKTHSRRFTAALLGAAILALCAAAPAAATYTLTLTPQHEKVVLTWPDVAGPNGFYDVYRNGNWYQYVHGPATGWTDTNVTNGVTYEYQVEAYEYINGGASNVYVDSSTTEEVTPPGVGFGCFDLGDLATGERPPACWRPFADSSPFNRKIPASPTLHPNSADIIDYMSNNDPPAKLASNTGGVENDWGHANYFAKSTDPSYTIDCTESWGVCEPETGSYRIPEDAVPAGDPTELGMDRHLSVAQPNNSTTLDLWQSDVPSGLGGTLDAVWGGVSELDGSGLGSNATAAMFGSFAGVIRAQEMEAERIDHALFAVVPCTEDYVYPAGKTAYECNDADAPPNGARLQLNMTEGEIEGLSVPRWKKTILHALREYGMIVGDTGGGNASFGLQFESGMVDRAFGNPEQMDQYAISESVPSWYNASTGRTEHVFDLAPGVDWWNELRVVGTCVSYGNC